MILLKWYLNLKAQHDFSFEARYNHETLMALKTEKVFVAL